MRQKLLANSVIHSVLTASVLALPMMVAADSYLYRYENEQGVKVIHHTIPPEFAQQGYEIISSRGQLVRVVPPAPSDSDIVREERERELREQYTILKRRYSSPDDIESAKHRRLKNINTNIAILRSNISGINTRIDNLMSRAADMERAGRKVSQNILQQIKDARAELAVAEGSLAGRLAEYNKVAERFDRDVLTFIEGSKLPMDEDERSIN